VIGLCLLRQALRASSIVFILKIKGLASHDDIMNLLNLLADAASQSPLPDAPQMMPSYEGAFLKMFLTLLALIVGIFACVWILKRLARGSFSQSSGKSIKILEKKPLSPKTMLYIIEVDGQETLIAESQLEVKKLITLSSEQESEE
jgi:flagellar biogenesis protein FliO